jgi:hypothetical protein
MWTFHDNHIERNGREGVAIAGAVNALFETNYIGQIRA